MIDYGAIQNNVETLPRLTTDRYENIFNVFKLSKDQDNTYYFYSILNKIQIPNTLDESIYDTIKLTKNLPWTTFSYQLYETTNLWWLIFLLNNPKNIFIAEAGREYKYILPEYIDPILTSIASQINV